MNRPSEILVYLLLAGLAVAAWLLVVILWRAI